ncbi:MAG: hypothetical protein Q4C52_03100 [Eubacteriales bacterium]|nr:hypothetical protein [Eubacteriales bacterium]
MKKIKKIIKFVLIAFVIVFFLSWIIYFFNLDMKASVYLKKLMDKVYDMRKRDRRL